MAEAINLISLNEHCLLHICNFLSAEDQIALSRVSTFFQDFFVNNAWKDKCKHINLVKPFWEKKENREYFPKFIDIIAERLEAIKLSSEDFDEFGSLLLKLNFPNVKFCFASFGYDMVDVVKLAQMFPNLKCLLIIGNLYGKPIFLLEKLERLSLKTNPYDLQLEFFDKVYSLPNLKEIELMDYYGSSSIFSEAIKNAYFSSTLEKIGFSEDVLRKGIMNSMKKMQNLRMITVWTESEKNPKTLINIEKFEKHFGPGVDTLVLSSLNISFGHPYEVVKFQFVRRIILFRTIIKDHVLLDLCQNMPESLEEFYYLCSKKEDEEVDANLFLPLIIGRHRFQLLDVSGNPCKKNFVADIAEAVKLEAREQPLTLTLRCFKTKITKQDVQDLALPDNLQISFLPGKYNFKMFKKANFQVQLDRTKIKKEEESEEEEEDFVNYEDDGDNCRGSYDVDFW